MEPEMEMQGAGRPSGWLCYMAFLFRISDECIWKNIASHCIAYVQNMVFGGFSMKKNELS
jgi:hypothetical protein